MEKQENRKFTEKDEVEVLHHLEKKINHHRKMERVHRCLLGGMLLVAVGAFFLGHVTPHRHH